MLSPTRYIRRGLGFDVTPPGTHEIPPLHYYGDTVRDFFIFGALIMLVTLPFVVDRLPVPLFVAILLVTLIVFFAGVTNPRQLWSAVIDVAVSLFASFIFEYYAVTTYIEHSWNDGFVWINEMLAIIFFIAFYFAVKTVRGFFLERKNGHSIL